MKAVFIALFFCVAYANAARTCTPFADGCTCQRTDDPNTYALVTCQFSGSLPPLVSAATNFTIQELFINLDKATVFEIPAKYFANVRDVQQLFLQTVGQNTAEQKWDDTAFDGLQPTILKTIGVTKMFPLPTTLKKAAKNLQLMSIKTAGTVGLDDGNFDNFGSLNTLHVINFDDTLKINKISDNAFNGAEGLTFIWMPYTDVKDFPANAFKKLTKLTKLWLKAGNFQNFPKDSFSSLKQLVELDLSNYMPGEGTTNLAQAQKDGIFNSLSPTARTLTLDYTGLTSVPTQVLKKNAIVTVDNGSLELNGNPIKTIRKGDFKDPVTAFNFYLDDSPLETIEPKAFPPLLAGFLEFKNTSLTSLDLATFSYAEYMDEAHNVNLFFDQCKKLTTITISKFDDIPDSAVAHFSIKNTGLQTVDASIGNFLAAKPGFFIDISTSRNYICEGSDWMGRFVACTQQLVIDRTVCKDQKGMSLSDYLTRKGPITC